MKKTAITIIALLMCLGCVVLASCSKFPIKNFDITPGASMEEKTSRKPVDPITDGGAFDW